ncbi:glycosyl transferase family 4 [Roseimicrobium gellanilyticum]|uniref:Glycosyl transferase family 4 n=1 Tax=Roseimicrobium gellanilyticum TaxID=748857 RepID=A0A366H4U5_9BACT|nr:glycosyltransferase family 1 protein [Roseimicrobium gellanilyticum]RBP36361.1 glycosyl transferase family 4 [Roseimicrobium gellanilyticum]
MSARGTEARVAWYPALPAEGWASMDRYWAELARCESGWHHAGGSGDRMKAAAPPWLGGPPARSAAAGRIQRAMHKHFIYPWRAGQEKAEVAHVLDHSYAHLIPHLKKGCRSVVATVFDLVPLQLADGLTPVQIERFRRTVMHLREADHLISISQETKDRLHEILGIDPSRVTVAVPGMDFARFQKQVPQDNEVAQRVRALPKILFSVGSAISRKNLGSLPGIFEHFRDEFRERRCVFVRAGERLPAELKARIEEVVGPEGFVELGPTYGDDLIAAYQSAHVFLFPSTLEGLTFTIPEAMAAGAAVVTNRSTANPEAAGDAALFYNEGDSAEAARLIMSLLKDGSLHAEMCAKGRERARAMTWERHYQTVRKVYSMVAGRAA